jgi:FkbM family methyltransferase
MTQILKTYLKPQSVFIDLGANEGYFSVIASKLVKSQGKVFAIEPQSRLQPIIKENINLNSCNNIQVLQVAISGKSETVTLFVSPDMNTGSTSLIQTTAYSLPKQEVTSITLAEFFQMHEIDTCDLIKIDIEGYEYEAIMKSPELFRTRRFKAIALELHPYYLEKRGLSGETITSFLSDCGYSIASSSSNTELLFVSPECNGGDTA